MEKIVSKDNKKIKLLKKLGTKKYRNKFGKFLVENIAIIYDAYGSGYELETLFITQELLDSGCNKIKVILERAGSENVFIIDDDVNKHFSSLESPSGIVAVYNKNKDVKLSFENKILYLNEIKDPGNLGTIFRSAVAFGVGEIVLDEGCVDLYNPKVIQSAKDAIFKINVVFDKERSIMQEIKGKMKIFVTDVEAGTDVREAFGGIDNFCVVLGSESHGVSDGVKSLTDEIVNIKSSSEMESLNVAVSAGIVLYEMYNN